MLLLVASSCDLVREWSDNEHFTLVSSGGGRIWIDRFRDFA